MPPASRIAARSAALPRRRRRPARVACTGAAARSRRGSAARWRSAAGSCSGWPGGSPTYSSSRNPPDLASESARGMAAPTLLVVPQRARAGGQAQHRRRLARDQVLRPRRRRPERRRRRRRAGRPPSRSLPGRGSAAPMARHRGAPEGASGDPVGTRSSGRPGPQRSPPSLLASRRRPRLPAAVRRGRRRRRRARPRGVDTQRQHSVTAAARPPTKPVPDRDRPLVAGHHRGDAAPAPGAGPPAARPRPAPGRRRRPPGSRAGRSRTAVRPGRPAGARSRRPRRCAPVQPAVDDQARRQAGADAEQRQVAAPGSSACDAEGGGVDVVLDHDRDPSRVGEQPARSTVSPSRPRLTAWDTSPRAASTTPGTPTPDRRAGRRRPGAARPRRRPPSHHAVGAGLGGLARPVATTSPCGSSASPSTWTPRCRGRSPPAATARPTGAARRPRRTDGRERPVRHHPAGYVDRGPGQPHSTTTTGTVAARPPISASVAGCR